MSSLVEIKDSQSARLEKIAFEKGVTPNALLEEALELLFQQTEREKISREEQAFLKQLEAENGAAFSIQTRPPFNREEITITHTVPIDPATLRRL